MTSKVLVGKILTAHGIKGEIKVLPYTDSTGDFCEIKNLHIINSHYEVQNSRPMGKMALIKLKDIDNRDSALNLKGDIFAERIDLPDKVGRYYINDILGFSLICNGIDEGILSEIVNYGTIVDTYFVKSKNGNYSFPALQEVIEEIDLDKKRIVLNEKELKKVRVYEI
jgi:16S rRNA processing protein RimM